MAFLADRAAAAPLRGVAHIWLWLALAIIAGTIVWHGATPANTDVSWLLTVGERWIDGEHLYRDVIETNPPASIAIYLPAILLARLSGATPELLTTALVTWGAVASLLLSAAMLNRTDFLRRDRMGPFLCAMLALTLLLPAGSFGEREHIAALSGLPLLAALAARLDGRVPDWRLAVLAAAGGALTIAIKPMFALAYAGPALLLLRRRGWRDTLRAGELYATGLAAGLYGQFVLLLFPDFTTKVLPWVVASYVPVRQSWEVLLTSSTTVLWAAMSITWVGLGRLRRHTTWSTVLMAASVGFYAAFLLQGKNWPYQILPATLLAAAAVLGWLVEPDDTTPGLRRVAAGALAVLCGLALTTFDTRLSLPIVAPGLREAIARLGPHPRVMAVTSEIALGHPLVREVGGAWVGSFGFLWITSGLDKQEKQGLAPADRAVLSGFASQERAIVASDLRDRRPDAVIVQGPRWMDYLAKDPALEAAFDPYRKEGDHGLVSLWVRKAP